MDRNIANRGALRARKIRLFDKPLVVGAAHTQEGLRLAQRLKPEQIDVIEVRVDALLNHLDAVSAALEKITLPVLITVRHPKEGGMGGLSVRARRELTLRFLPRADLLDIELRSAAGMRDLIGQAKAAGTRVIISDHHFRRAPSLEAMIERQKSAFRAGADVFKLAALLPGPGEFARLLEFAGRKASGPRALMGMGAFGQVSRLAMARAGSVLNYGYLDKPNAPGQWEARELKALLSRMV
jgi:3-dehydroquinate dehydratase I